MNPNDLKFCLRCGQPMSSETSQRVNEAFAKVGSVLPGLVENEKAMRDFRRLLAKHNIQGKG